LAVISRERFLSPLDGSRCSAFAMRANRLSVVRSFETGLA
jgi:hypothetical protein